MAYRDFHWEPQSSVPRRGGTSASNILDSAASSVSAIFKAIQGQKVKKQQAADNYKYTIEKGTDVNDDIMMESMAKEVVDTTRKGIMSEDPAIKNKAKELQSFAVQSQETRRKQDQQFKLNDDAAKAKAAADPDYNYDIDKKVNGEAFFGPGMNGERNFTNRQEHLDKASGIVGRNPDALDETGRAKRFVGQMAADELSGKTSAGDSFTKKGVFFNGAKPEITDEHVAKFFGYGGDDLTVQKLSKQVDQELLNEARNFKQKNPQETKGMSDQEVFNYLKDNPTDNPLNKNGYNTRVIDKGRRLLKDAEATINEYNRKEVDPAEANKLYKNDKVVHSYSNVDNKVSAASGDGGTKAVVNGGSGGVIMMNNGAPIKFNSSNPVRTNINTSTTSKSKIGNDPFYMTSYQIGAFRQQDKGPLFVKGATPEERIQTYESLPYEFFDPNGKWKAKPRLSIGINGYSVNAANILNAASNKQKSLQAELNDARTKGDTEKASRLEMAISQIDEISKMKASGADENEILLAAEKAGVNNVQSNELIEASDSDISSINGLTQGLNLKDRSNWSDPMKAEFDAYAKRADEAKAAGYKSEKPVVEKVTKTTLTSDGSDIESWKTTSEYKVGDKTYFYDKGTKQWKKR